MLVQFWFWFFCLELDIIVVVEVEISNLAIQESFCTSLKTAAPAIVATHVCMCVFMCVC